VAVQDKLASLPARGCKAQSVYYVVEPSLKKLQQFVAGDSLSPRGNPEIPAKLALLDPLDPLCLLFFA